MAVDRRQGGGLESRSARRQGDGQRPRRRSSLRSSATSPTSSTNIPSPARNCATTASASARTAAISRSPRPSRNIRSAPSSPSITTRCIRTRRCWSATCRRACGVASASERRSCSRSCSARRSGCIKLSEFVSQRLVDPKLSPLVSPSAPSASSWRCSRSPCSGRHRWRSKWPVVTGHHQAVGTRAVPCRAQPTAGARAGHVSAQGVLHLHLRTTIPIPACTPASPATSRRRSGWLMRKFAGLSGRRQREGLGQSRQSVGSNARAAHQFAWILWLLVPRSCGLAYYIAVHG